MKYYYFSENDLQFGPFTLDEIKGKRIKKSTLVWTDGLENWMTADKIEELREYLISEPPPLPNWNTIELDKSVEIKQIPSSVSNDYSKEIDATVIGFLLLILPIILYLFNFFNFESEESYNQGKIFLAIASIVIRIFVTVRVIDIARRQNRNSNDWGWLAFFFPSIALIVIGLQNKLPLKINIDSSISSDEQIKILKNIADNLINDLRFIEALSVLIKIKELDYNYPEIDDEIRKCQLKNQALKNNTISKEEKSKPEKVLYEYKTTEGKLEIEQSQNSYPEIHIGKKAVLNGQRAPTGKYKLGFMWHVHIENGIVKKVSTL